MRVRMLRQYEKSHSHTTLGVLTLIFAAGTTQYFPNAEAQRLVDATDNGKPRPAAEAYPEESVRVQMLRTMDVDGVRYAKGDLVHFAIGAAQQLLDAEGENGAPSPAAELAPDVEANHEQATIDAAVEAAIERKRVADEATARREQLNKVLASAGSGATSTPTAATRAPTSTTAVGE